MGGSHAGAAIRRAADDDRAIAKATGHVADAGGVADKLVKSHGMKRPEHQFHDWAHPEHGSTYAHADKTGFGNGSIDDALVAPFFPKTFGDFVSTVVLGDFFAHQDDLGIAGEFFVEAFTKGFTVGENAGHGNF